MMGRHAQLTMTTIRTTGAAAKVLMGKATTEAEVAVAVVAVAVKLAQSP